MSFVRRASLLDVVYWPMNYTGNGRDRKHIPLNAIYAKFKMVSIPRVISRGKNCVPVPRIKPLLNRNALVL